MENNKYFTSERVIKEIGVVELSNVKKLFRTIKYLEAFYSYKISDELGKALNGKCSEDRFIRKVKSVLKLGISISTKDEKFIAISSTLNNHGERKFETINDIKVAVTHLMSGNNTFWRNRQLSIMRKRIVCLNHNLNKLDEFMKESIKEEFDLIKKHKEEKKFKNEQKMLDVRINF